MNKFLALVIVLGLIVAGVVEWGYAAFSAPGPAAAHGTETIVVVKHKRGWFREEVHRQKSDALQAFISMPLVAAIALSSAILNFH